jgi:PKD repeat protein
VYAAPGTYTVTLRVIDKWGRNSAAVTQNVTTAPEPAGNAAPAVTFAQPSCTGRTCPVSGAATDADGGIRSYTWKWGDGTADTVSTSTSSTNNSSHAYLGAGTFTITLVVTDNWGKATTVTRSVTVT